MKAIVATVNPSPRQNRSLLVMLPVAIIALSGPLPAKAEKAPNQGEYASQLQNGPDASEQMVAHQTSPSTEVQPSPGSDRPMLARPRQAKCARNETVIDGRCVARHTDKPHKQAERMRPRDEAPVRRARVVAERPAKTTRLCWTQDGRHFSVSPCN
jgi:hypothetical protein